MNKEAIENMTTEEFLEEIRRLEAEMHELEKDLTEEERRSLIHGMDDEPYECDTLTTSSWYNGDI